MELTACDHSEGDGCLSADLLTHARTHTHTHIKG